MKNKKAFTFRYTTTESNASMWIVVTAIDRKHAISRLIEWLKDQRNEEIIKFELTTENDLIE